jgi:hypothetical protein
MKITIHHNKRVAMAFLMVLFLSAGGARSGEIIDEINCRKVPEVSYMMYLPTRYMHHSEPAWPVLFVMSPDGGKREDLERYIKGAEKNGWVVAMSIQSGKPSKKSEFAVAAMVNDVCRRFTVDMERGYASGMGGGARMAFWLANEQQKMIRGIIPCCGGDTGYKYECLALAYGLCGGRCFTRWEMAITFNELVRKRGRLRFFEGGHDWAGEDLISDAMTWLNARYLAEKGTQPEIDRFSSTVYEEILDQYQEDPYFVYRQAVILAEVPLAPHAKKAGVIAEDLAAQPHIAQYIDGLKAMDRFVEKHFDTDAGNYRNNRLTQRQKEDADQLLETFGETPLAPIIQDFGMPSVEFPGTGQ